MARSTYAVPQRAVKVARSFASNGIHFVIGVDRSLVADVHLQFCKMRGSVVGQLPYVRAWVQRHHV